MTHTDYLAPCVKCGLPLSAHAPFVPSSVYGCEFLAQKTEHEPKEKEHSAPEPQPEYVIPALEPVSGESPQRRRCRTLLAAWADAMRQEFYDYIEAAGSPFPERLAAARHLMAQDGYRDMDPICSAPGMKPMIAMVGNRECISYEHSLPMALPLSSVYLATVTEVVTAMEESQKATEPEPEPDKNHVVNES